MESFRDIRDLGDGNTIHPPSKSQTTQLTSWFFTYNNYSPTDIETIETILKPLCKWFCFQEEKGESGTPHLQGCLVLKKKMRFSEFKLPKQIHWEKTRNLASAKEYCQKLDSRNGRVITFGLPKPIKIIDSLYPFQQKILDIFLQDPDDRIVNWFWEDTGNIGKSSFVKYMVVKHGCQFCDGGKKADLVNLVFNTDMDNCKAIIWDIPRSAQGHISYSTLESIKNGLICNTKYETGVKAFNSPHIFVFANFPPDDTTQLSADRWNIKEIIDKDFM